MKNIVYVHLAGLCWASAQETEKAEEWCKNKNSFFISVGIIEWGMDLVKYALITHKTNSKQESKYLTYWVQPYHISTYITINTIPYIY